MDFTFTTEQEAWRQEVRSFLEKHVTKELIERCEEDHSEWDSELYQKLANAGYLGVAIPKELGGHGRGFTEQAIFSAEMARAKVPHGVSGTVNVSTHWVGNAISQLGTKEQKEYYLPKILSGEHTWSLGLTEPGCGSDLAAVETLVTEDGDDLVVTGTKSFNSAHITTHIILVVRTNPLMPKHRGIGLIMMDLRNPQISMGPLFTLRGWRRNTVYFDNVRVPRSCLLGRKDSGWYDLMSVMHLERSDGGPVDMEVLFDELVEYAKHAERDGRSLASYPDVRESMADIKWELTIGRLLANRVVWLQETGQNVEAHIQGTVQKLYNSEAMEHITNRAMELVGLSAVIEWANANETGKALSPLQGALVRNYKDARIMQIAGGSSEIQRNIIARHSLGLPK